MKRQIRRGVFETNSSSMHSLVIMKRDEKYTSEEILDDIYLHNDNETGEKHCIWEPWESDMRFGRSPFKLLASFTDKWLYACASLVYEYNDDTYKELVDIAIKYIPNLKKIKLPTISEGFADKDDEQFKNDEYYQKYGKTEDELAEYLMKKEEDWGMEINYWKTSKGWWKFDKPYTGSVDENILSGFLIKEKLSLEEFLINKKYIVIQDGDEYCEYDNFKNSGLININIIDRNILKEIIKERLEML